VRHAGSVNDGKLVIVIKKANFKKTRGGWCLEAAGGIVLLHGDKPVATFA
jgi:hypothetical protein